MTSQQDQNASPALDADALRSRYRRERDKRLRSDGNNQYLAMNAGFAHYAADPNVRETIERDPLEEDSDVVVIGGGFGGLISGARLREAGFDNVRIIEKGDDFGGTWYWNRYPGAQCDIEAYVYLPLLEELGRLPSEKYAHQPEIQAHARAIGRHYDLYRNACFQTTVTALSWEESLGRWRVLTDRGDTIHARFVLTSTGPLNQPKLPGIPGIGSFRGHSFHTSRWDYDYTGGSSSGELGGLTDKRVAIIGTGATAVQCIPHLGASARQLYVFQRTPSSVDARNNELTAPEWADALKPGWQRERIENFSTVVTGVPTAEDLVADGWTDLFRKLVFRFQQDPDPDLSPQGIARAMEEADFEKMEEIRARAEALVENPDTAEALKPWYRQFCKRPCFHDEYLATFNRDNVTLVDTQGQGVERITPLGVVVDGVEYIVDCIIFATGFEVGTGWERRSGYNIQGHDGQYLTDKWADGVSTFQGLQTQNFPNLFFLGGAQTGFSPNFTHMLDENARHIAYLMKEATGLGHTRIEATPEAEAQWVQTCIDKVHNLGTFFEDCTPGYYNNEGQASINAGRDGWYGGGCVEYFALLAAWRERGELEGLSLA